MNKGVSYMGFELGQAWASHIEKTEEDRRRSEEAKRRREESAIKLEKLKTTAQRIVGVKQLDKEASFDQNQTFSDVTTPITLGELAEPDQDGRTHGFAVLSVHYDKTPKPENVVVKRRLLPDKADVKLVWVQDRIDLTKLTGVSVRFMAGDIHGQSMVEITGAGLSWSDNLCDGDRYVAGLLERLEFIDDHIANTLP